MKVVAITKSILELMSTSAGTLLKLSNNAQICFVSIERSNISTQKEINKLFSSFFTNSQFQIISFDGFVTQDNVFQLRNIFNSLNPEIVIFPFYQSKRKKFANLGKCSILAAHEIKSLLMFEPQTNLKFIPTIISDIKKFRDQKTKLFNSLLKIMITDKKSSKKVLLNYSNTELFQSYRIISSQGFF
jgi:hypothetical protein